MNYEETHCKSCGEWLQRFDQCSECGRDKQMTEKFYEDKEELDVQETRIIKGPNSYNDNWDLVNYTSELRDSKGGFYAFVDFHENEGQIRECPHCLEYEIHNKLKPRMLKKGEVKPPDYDDFIQCWDCGNVYPIYQSYPESEIKDSLETVKDPFENSESIFLSTDSRATQRRKRDRKDHYRKGVINTITALRARRS